METQPTNTSPHVQIVTRPDGSSYAMPAFRWDIDKEQAAVDLAEGRLTIRQIADRAGASVAAVHTWRAHPEFDARVKERQKAFAEQVMSFGLTQRATRLQALQDQMDATEVIITERGEYFRQKYPDVPGGHTGYVASKMTAYGVEFMPDTKLIATRNDLLKQAAIEVGEWNEGTGPSVAVQIVVPAGAPDVSKVPTVTIGTR